VETCLVLSARRYDFKDTDTGRQVEGVTVTYITGDPEVEGDTRGCQPLSITAASSCWPDLLRLPAHCDLDFKQRPGPKGKPTLQLVRLVPLESVDVSYALPEPPSSE
jgi:hypothetical protein